MGTPLRTLIVEDSDDDATLLVRELTKAGYDVDFERVETPEGLVDALDHGGWDLVCADYTMPSFLGTKALSMVRGRERDLPFIFVSGTIGEDVAVEAMKAGANDYVIKGNLKRFVPAVARELRDAEVRQERARLEAELRQAQRLESVGRLASGLAHDFNNLLTVIGGYAQMLRLDADQDPEEAEEDIAEIRRAVERGAALTRQLLAFSRQQILELSVLDLNALVEEMEQMASRLFGSEIDVVTRLAPDLGHVEADAGELHQVLMNLVVNARDAMPDGGRLVIETANAELGEEVWADGEPGRYVSLVVRDTGVGMDAETRAHIFDPFFTTKGSEGTGLGLPTAYGIVKQSGGHIRVESEPGEGTEFTIYLPRTDEAVDEWPSGGEEDPLPTGSEVVLAVEDETPVRQLIERVLTDRGYTVLAATRAAEALRWLRHRDHDIHMVLTGARMPEMSGYELAELARSIRPRIPVLRIADRPEAERAADGGGAAEAHDDVAVLRKPFTSADLAHEVRSVLDDASDA